MTVAACDRKPTARTYIQANHPNVLHLRDSAQARVRSSHNWVQPKPSARPSFKQVSGPSGQGSGPRLLPDVNITNATIMFARRVNGRWRPCSSCNPCPTKAFARCQHHQRHYYACAMGQRPRPCSSCAPALYHASPAWALNLLMHELCLGSHESATL